MIERPIERTLYASRWLLAPLYLGLSLGLLALGVNFFQQVFHALGHVLTMEEADLVLVVLSTHRHHPGGQPHRDGDVLGLRELRVAHRHGHGEKTRSAGSASSTPAR